MGIRPGRRILVMTTKRIGIIGKGNVGSAIARGLERQGLEVRSVGNDPERVRQTAAWAEVVVLAVPYDALDDVVDEVGEDVAGKTVVDVTNLLDENMNLALGFTTSGAEELQNKLPNAHVVKAFNTVFARYMDSGRLGEQSLTTFVAGDDQDAKSAVLELANQIGFDAVDAGPLRNARLLEPLGCFNVQLGYVLGLGTQIGFKLLRDTKE